MPEEAVERQSIQNADELRESFSQRRGSDSGRTSRTLREPESLTQTSESQQELVANIVITQQPEHRTLPGEPSGATRETEEEDLRVNRSSPPSA